MLARARTCACPRRCLRVGAGLGVPSSTTGGFGGSGVPDIVGCYHGKFFGIECKAGKNKPTPLQQKNLDSIKAMGGVAMVINEDNIEDVSNLMRSIERSR